MKLSRLQIIILLLLFYIQMNKTSQPFTPDLSAAEFESRTIAGLHVMLSESPFEQSDPTIESLLEDQNLQEETKSAENNSNEIVATTNARLVLLTDPINCAPCRNLEANVISRLKGDEGKSANWKIGTDENNNIQVVDRNKDFDKFMDYIADLNKFIKNGVGIPVMFKVDQDGNIDQSSVRMGSMTMKEFGEYYNGLFNQNAN